MWSRSTTRATATHGTCRKPLENTNVQSAPLPKHPSATGPLRQLRFDPQGGVWASGDFPHLVRWAVDIWKPAGKAVLATNSPARQFCISQDGTYLLAATDQTFCTAIRRSEGGDFERSVRTEHTSSLPKIQRILPAGADYFALLGGDGSIEFWRGRDDQFAGQFPAAVEGVTCVTYAPPLKMTLTGHADGSISLWSVDGLRERPESLQADLQLKVQKLLTEKKFDELTDELDRLRKTHAIIPNGNPALYAIDCQLASAPAGSDWDTLHATLAEWRAAKPKSIAPLIIEAEALKCEGWEARGSGVAGTVTQAGWQKFGEKLEQALKIIDEAEQLDEKDTELYRTQIGIFMGIGRPMEEIEAARKKAAEIDPDCYAVYEQEAVARLPRWGGGAPGEIAKWAGELCDNLKRHGDEVYARIAMQLTRYAKNDMFAESHLDWDRIKRGLDKLMERFDDSSDFANDAAFMAILQLDHAEAQKVLPILGLNRRSSMYWSDGDQLRQWQKWAAADEVPVSPEQTRAIVIPQGATCAGLSAEGNLLVTIGTASGGFMQIRETKGWNTVWHNEHMGTDFSVLAVHPDGPLVAVSGGPIAPLNVQPKNYSCGAEIFDFTKGMPQVTGLHGGHGHSDLIKATAFSPDGESWATGSLDCDLKIWKIPLQHPLPSVLKQPSGVVGLTYSADGKSIAVATLKDGVLLWNLDAPLTPDKPPGSKQLYSPDEGQALATSHDGTLAGLLKQRRPRDDLRLESEIDRRHVAGNQRQYFRDRFFPQRQIPGHRRRFQSGGTVGRRHRQTRGDVHRALRADSQPRFFPDAPGTPKPRRRRDGANLGCFEVRGKIRSLRSQLLRRRNAVANLLEVIHATLVRGDDIQQPIAVHIGHFELRAHAAGMIDFVRNEFGFAVLPHKLVPIQLARLIVARFVFRRVRPPAPAGYQIGQAVAVNIGQHERMRFGVAIIDFMLLPAAVL